jgi:hypothetical protein
MGCKYYAPSEAELQTAVEDRKKRLDDISKQLVEYIAQVRTGDTKKIDTDKLFLDTHTGAIRFKKISDKYAEEAEYKWRRYRGTQKNSF